MRSGMFFSTEITFGISMHYITFGGVPPCVPLKRGFSRLPNRGSVLSKRSFYSDKTEPLFGRFRASVFIRSSSRISRNKTSICNIRRLFTSRHVHTGPSVWDSFSKRTNFEQNLKTEYTCKK